MALFQLRNNDLSTSPTECNADPFTGVLTLYCIQLFKVIAE